MNEYEATEIAKKIMATEIAWPCPLIGATESKVKHGYWGVLFQRRLPDGTIVDGPIVVMVRKSDGNAHVL